MTWMKVDGMDESEWKRMKADENWWNWMKLDETGWRWMKLDETGWMWMERVSQSVGSVSRVSQLGHLGQSIGVSQSGHSVGLVGSVGSISWISRVSQVRGAILDYNTKRTISKLKSAQIQNLLQQGTACGTYDLTCRLSTVDPGYVIENSNPGVKCNSIRLGSHNNVFCLCLEATAFTFMHSNLTQQDWEALCDRSRTSIWVLGFPGRPAFVPLPYLHMSTQPENWGFIWRRKECQFLLTLQLGQWPDVKWRWMISAQKVTSSVSENKLW